MPDDELRAAGRLAGEYAGKAVTSVIQGVHHAVSGRVFGAIGVGSSLARGMHDAISSGAYGALRLGGHAFGGAVAASPASWAAARSAAP